MPQRNRAAYALSDAVCRLLLLCVVMVAGLAISAAAQQAPPPSDPQDEPVTTLKGGIDVVNVYFNVKDKKGGLIPALTKDEFDVEEDGTPQSIRYFTAETNLPLTLAILIDSSPSQERVLEIEKQVGGQFLREFLKEKDEAAIISFDSTVDLLQDFTNSTRMLSRGLEKARVGGGGGGSMPGLGGGPVPTSRPKGTVLYDAVYVASHEKLSSEAGRKAIILLTDGEDQGSDLTIKEAEEAAQKADTICYVLLIADRGFYGGFGYHGDYEMKRLTEETGGRVIVVGNKQDKLKEAFDQISAELRSQYSVGYVPTNRKKDGTYRKLNVKSKQGYKIQARKGYYATGE